MSGLREARDVAAVLPSDGDRQGDGGEAVHDGRAGGRAEVPAVCTSPGDVEPTGGGRQ